MSDKKVILIEVGPPGSGKSRHAKVIENSSGYVRVSQDDQGKKGHMKVFDEALADGRNIVIDRMGFSKAQRDRYADPARKAGYEVRIVVHHVPKAVCLERMLSRNGHPTIKGEKGAQAALKTFFGKYERVEDDEASLVVRLGHDNVGRPIAIYSDLDGTLCDVEHRRKYLHRDKEKGIKPNWKMFFKEMVNDTVNVWCYDIIMALGVQYPIIFATGRPDNFYKETYEWLNNHKVFMTELYMRPRFDSRQDNIVKEIILEFEILPRYKVHFAIDDRRQVVDMLRKHGVTVLQCAKGDF